MNLLISQKISVLHLVYIAYSIFEIKSLLECIILTVHKVCLLYVYTKYIFMKQLKNTIEKKIYCAACAWKIVKLHIKKNCTMIWTGGNIKSVYFTFGL